MPTNCGHCGTLNRDNARYCSGCAGRLPGFAPSGTAASTAPQPLQQASRRSEPARTPVSAGTSAASPGSFWLHLGLLVLAMIIGFVGWALYVTHRPFPPNPRSEVATASAPPTPVAAPSADTKTVSTSEPARTAAPALPAAPEPAARTAVPAPVRAERRTTPERSMRAPRAIASAQPSFEPSFEPSLEPAWRAPVAMTPPQADPGPPVVIGPGPLYNYTSPGAAPR